MKRSRPSKQSKPQEATIIECGNGRVIISKLSSPMTGQTFDESLTVCLEFHELRTLPSPQDEISYSALVTFALLTDREAQMVAEALKERGK
jgi:hypothetical protein